MPPLSFYVVKTATAEFTTLNNNSRNVGGGIVNGFENHTFERLIPILMTTSAPPWRKKTGESIPSFERDEPKAAYP
jgi:hypothetical protein